MPPLLSSAISRRTISRGQGRQGERAISTLTITRAPVVSARDAERALRAALSRGGDFGELFWERHETLQLVLDDGRIEDAISGVDQGAGNLTQLLAAVTGVGTDLTFGPSGIGSPTLVISELSIGGT